MGKKKKKKNKRSILQESNPRPHNFFPGVCCNCCPRPRNLMTFAIILVIFSFLTTNWVFSETFKISLRAFLSGKGNLKIFVLNFFLLFFKFVDFCTAATFASSVYLWFWSWSWSWSLSWSTLAPISTSKMKMLNKVWRSKSKPFAQDTEAAAESRCLQRRQTHGRVSLRVDFISAQR